MAVLHLTSISDDMGIIQQKQRIDDKSNKSQISDDKKIAITSIENLPNECFYETFEYLDSYDIFKAFSNLNDRFENVLTSYFPVRIDYSSQSNSILQHCDQQLMISNRYRITSLCLLKESEMNLFFTSYNIDSSFVCLQLLILKNITSIKLASLLKDLVSLPCLISLVITISDDSELLVDIYQHIFRLPKLKYLKISLPADEQFDLLPLADTSTKSNIEYLNIDYPCSLEELTAIASYTPKLTHLTCASLCESELNMNEETTIILLDLTNLNIQECHMSFDELEIFLKKISSQLQILRINTFENEFYIDPERWEQLILQHIPHLQKFYFSHQEDNIEPYENKQYHPCLDQFNSSFWTERQWIFELEVNYTETIYSIQPHRHISMLTKITK